MVFDTTCYTFTIQSKESFLEVFQSCIMLGSGPLKFQGVTYKGRKLIFLECSRIIHQKKRLKPLMIKTLSELEYSLCIKF